MKISFRTNLQIAGWFAIFSPIVAIINGGIPLLIHNHNEWLVFHIVSSSVLSFVLIYSYYYFMEYLDKLERIQSLNTVIRTIIYAAIIYFVVDTISQLAFSGNIVIIGAITTAYALLQAILLIIFSIKLMELDKKHQALRRFGKWSLIANICEITLILAPIGIVFDVVASIMMGKILFLAAKTVRE